MWKNWEDLYFFRTRLVYQFISWSLSFAKTDNFVSRKMAMYLRCSR